jgi:hypothetical protein
MHLRNLKIKQTDNRFSDDFRRKTELNFKRKKTKLNCHKIQKLHL